MAGLFRKTKDFIALLTVKPKNILSLDQLKALHNILLKNIRLTSENQSLLVETLHAISEILIWGDKNDSRVFDFFLENHTLLFFLNILKQNCSVEIAIQLLQTLNILCENIKNKNSLYCFLSNNSINAIIIHKFEFENEEIIAYYVSFLKTLSFKLDKSTINLFFDSSISDFPLLTESLKFHDHKDSMVRIAIQTLILKVLKVDHSGLKEFLIERIIPVYIPSLIWKMGHQIIDMNAKIIKFNNEKFSCIKDQICNYLDYLHYFKDLINIFPYDKISELYIKSILDNIIFNSLNSLQIQSRIDEQLQNSVFLRPQLAIFLIIENLNVFDKQNKIHQYVYGKFFSIWSVRELLSIANFMKPPESLEIQLKKHGIIHHFYNLEEKFRLYLLRRTTDNNLSANVVEFQTLLPVENTSIEKSVIIESIFAYNSGEDLENTISLADVINSILHKECFHTGTLMIIICLIKCFLSLLIDDFKNNECISDNYKNMMNTNKIVIDYMLLVFVILEKIILSTNSIIYDAVDNCVTILMVTNCFESINHDLIVARIMDFKENCKSQLRLIYNDAECFLDLFEEQMRKFSEFIVINDFNPKNLLNYEKSLRDIRFLIENEEKFQANTTDLEEIKYQRLWLTSMYLHEILTKSPQNDSPNENDFVEYSHPFRVNPLPKIGTSVDLTDCELTVCTLIKQDQTLFENSFKVFIFIGVDNMMILEADYSNKIGWGLLKNSFYLTNISLALDPMDSRCLNMCALSQSSNLFSTASRLHRMSPSAAISAINSVNEKSLFVGKLIFEDYIRCMLIRQRIHRRIATLRRNRRIFIMKWLELLNQNLIDNKSHNESIIYSENNNSNFWTPSSRTYIKRQSSE